MRQSKLSSLAESVLGVVVGYAINVFAQYMIFPMFGINISLSENMAIGAIFTFISIGRSYLIRRWFNHWLHREAA